MTSDLYRMLGLHEPLQVQCRPLHKWLHPNVLCTVDITSYLLRLSLLLKCNLIINVTPCTVIYPKVSALYLEDEDAILDAFTDIGKVCVS